MGDGTSTRQETWDSYVRSTTDEALQSWLADTNGFEVAQIALALVRQRARTREHVLALVAQLDGLEQVLGMIQARQVGGEV